MKKRTKKTANNLYYICLFIAVISLMMYTIKRDQKQLQQETKRMSKTFEKFEDKANNVIEYAIKEFKNKLK